ncbi:zinc-binding dehydrogenase [Sphingomonas oligophenolica]|uniref:Alcohol dehydrogenase catalytic domain-containing protein n=1 Tax=Sphingomonas oligophenolica TaxID=301154 RepID=A0ABU9YBN3_9SPHN
MKAVRVLTPGSYSIDDVPMPSCGPRDALIKVSACGICGSDLHFVKWGTLRADGQPMALGHEATGIVESVGSAVDTVSPGMRVFISPTASDGSTIGAGIHDGAFASHVVIRDAVLGKNLLPLPADLDLHRAALVEPLAVGLHTVNRGNPDTSTKAVVFGCGPIGLAAVLWLARRNVRHITAIDIADERLAYATQMGAHAVINPNKEDLPARLAELQGAGDPIRGQPTVGTDVFYDLAAGPGVIENITGMAKFRSRLVIGAIYFNPVPMNFRALISREMEITTAGPYEQELHDALAELPNVDPATLDAYVTATLPFSDFDKAFELAKQPSSAKVMVTFD